MLLDELILLGPGDRQVSASGPPVAVWLALDSSGNQAELVARIAQRWPDRPLDPAAVDDAVEKLRSAGVIEIDS